MLGMPIIYREKLVLSFDMIFKRLPENMQKVVAILLDVAIAFFGLFMGIQGIRYIIKMGTNILPGIGIPQWIIYVSQPIGGFLLTIVAIESAILGILYFMKRNELTIEGGDN
jgi:TRAP-type C4-dicarboxylate transport system permease small subunit